MCAGYRGAMQSTVCLGRWRGCPETSDAHRKRLVMYHVHDALRHKRELSHGRERMVLEEKQAHGRCKDAKGEQWHWWKSDRSVQANLSGCQGFIHGFGFGAVGARGYFGRKLLNAQEGHSWSMMEKNLPLQWHSFSDMAIDEDRSQYTIDHHADNR